MADTIEGFSYDTTGQEVPQEVSTDDLWQLADVIQQQVEWVIGHSDHKEVPTNLRTEFRSIEGAARRAKEMRQESIERKLEGQEAQTTLLEASADE